MGDDACSGFNVGYIYIYISASFGFLEVYNVGEDEMRNICVYIMSMFVDLLSPLVLAFCNKRKRKILSL